MSTNRGQSTAAGARRCPTGWNTSAQNSQECFPECPAGWTFKNPGTGVMANGRVDPNPSCVFNSDPKFYVAVRNTNINNPASTFTARKAELDAAVKAMNTNQIGRQRQIEEARTNLLNAEDGRDINPAGYQQARTRYYTLLNGDTWINTERQRIGAAIVEPAVQNYRIQAQNLLTRLQSQDQYSDIVRNTSESVLKAKDNFKYVVDKFNEQLEMINVETQRKKRESQQSDLVNLEYISSILNWTIVVLLVVLAGAVLYRVYKRYSGPQTFERSGTISFTPEK